MEPVKCSRGCTRSHYPNEMLEIVAGKKTYKLCTDCVAELYAFLRRKSFYTTHGERMANKREAARATAWNFGSGWHIEKNIKPIPDRNHDFDFWHDDLDIGNGLSGTASSVEDAKQQIEDMEAER